MERFGSRVALITGAASGIGLASARRLHAEGAAVVLLDRNGDLLESAVADLGDRSEAVTCDVADHASVAAAIADVSARHGRLDVLVTAAGVDQCDTVPNTTIEQWTGKPGTSELHVTLGPAGIRDTATGGPAATSRRHPGWAGALRPR